MTNELNWNLHDIIPTDNFEKLYSQVETELLQYKTFKQDLNPGMSEEKFKKVLEFSEQFKEKLSKQNWIGILVSSIAIYILT